MAHIVCEYRLPDCQYLERQPIFTPNYIPDWCDDEARFECDLFQTKEGEIGRCLNFCWRHYQFETTVKNYEYSDNPKDSDSGLRIKGKFIIYGLIDYLEIDGSVLIGERNDKRKVGNTNV